MTTDPTAPAIREQTVEVWGGRLAIRVKIAGTGAPLLYLHATTGPAWLPFLNRLAEQYTVYAPEFPGTSAGDPYAVHVLDDLSDLVLVYEEVVRRLGLDRPILVGHSFGGMLAAELAAHHPALPGRLVLIDSLGLWQPDLPVVNLMAADPVQAPGLLFHNPEARAALKLPADPGAASAEMVRRIWALGCTGKFVWPFADHGLRARLHRVAVPTLVVWGREDRLVPVGYAAAFGDLIAGSKVALIEDCGHLPQVERLKETCAALDDFLV